LHYFVKYAMKVNDPYESTVTEINHEYVS